MKKYLKIAFKSVTLTLLLVGIFWVPKDLEDWPTAAEPWKRWLGMLDQNALLWAFSLSLLAWFIWVQMRPALKKALKHPVQIEWPFTDIYSLMEGDEVTTIYPITVKSDRKNIADVELRFLKMALVKPSPKGYMPIKERLCLRLSGEKTFDLIKRAPVELSLLRKKIHRQKSKLPTAGRFEIGPLESGRYIPLSEDGIYKIDIAIYGRDIEPRECSLMVGQDDGVSTFGFWRDDARWPLKVRTTKSEDLEPLSPPSTES